MFWCDGTVLWLMKVVIIRIYTCGKINRIVSQTGKKQLILLYDDCFKKPASHL